MSIKLGDVLRTYDGSGDFSEWIGKFELVGKLQGLKDLEKILPLFLAAGAFSVYDALSDDEKNDYGRLKWGLRRAFCMDRFKAYEKLMSRRLGDGESVDIYLADVKRLISIIDDEKVCDSWTKCAFVNGLPDFVKQHIKSNCAVEELPLNEIVVMARSITKSDMCLVSMSNKQLEKYKTASNHQLHHVQKKTDEFYPMEEKRMSFRTERNCYACGKIGHFIRECPERRCFVCGNNTHLAPKCPKKFNSSSKKLIVRKQICAAGFLPFKAQLPGRFVFICGKPVKMLIDTCCNRSIIIRDVVKDIKFRQIKTEIFMMNCESSTCNETCEIHFKVAGKFIKLNCLVVDKLPECDMIFGMDGIKLLDGVLVTKNGESIFGIEQTAVDQRLRCNMTVQVNDGVVSKKGDVSFGVKDVEAMGKLKPSYVTSSNKVEWSSKKTEIIDKDFEARFSDSKWTVKYNVNSKEAAVKNRLSHYPIKKEIRESFDKEMERWIDEGWLIKYDGYDDGIVPLMAVYQQNKDKVRPVLDFRELNVWVSSHSAESDVCGEKLRRWRQMGSNLCVIDLKNAYLQLHVSPELWKYQLVKHNGHTYALTRLGFGLNVAPKIMTAVVKHVLCQDEQIRKFTDSYIDDIIVNLDHVSAEDVVKLLDSYGLVAKPPESLKDGRILGLRVYEKGGVLMWKRDNCVSDIESMRTKRQLFSWCGQVIGHFPRAGWLRPACSFVKRMCNGIDWDGLVDTRVFRLIEDIKDRLKKDDPVGGQWYVPAGVKGRVWCDASSLGIGVCIEVGEVIVEDNAWLRKKDDTQHINLAELEGVIKGINLAIQWNLKDIEIMCDSATVCTWLKSILSMDKRLRVYGLSEMLVKRRLMLFRNLIDEYGLQLRVSFVKSAENKADMLTRVPQKWLKATDWCMLANINDENSIKHVITKLHRLHHCGVDKTWFIARRFLGHVEKRYVDDVIKACEICKSIDPNPVRWNNGELDVKGNGKRIACDVTHYGGKLYFTSIDCGPSRFCLWRKLDNESADSISTHLDEIFRERGPPEEILCDNGKSFRSEKIRCVCEKWGVNIRFRCAYRPSGNGIVERSHRTIKRMAARTQRDVLEMVFYYNILPKNGVETSSVPSSQIYSYEWKLPLEKTDSRPIVDNRFCVGDQVFVKPGEARCTTRWHKGRVTCINSEQSIDVNGVPRHVADVRHDISQNIQTQLPEGARQNLTEDPNVGSEFVYETDEDTQVSERDDNEGNRRSHRSRRMPTWAKDYVFYDDDITGECD